MLKRVFDVCASGLGIIITSPLFLVAAIMVKRDSPGPVFYRAQRVGRHGQMFTMYKFRSMVVNADKLGGPSTAGDDPRLTRSGQTLKKYQLDELPQLLNVFKGDMSLVGPRPEVKTYTDLFTPEEKAILSVPPGMTDFASLWDFHEGEILKGSVDPEKAYLELVRPDKIRLQLKYVREHSFLVDLVILFKTVGRVFKG
jgi:lipopolysaccharide/colanic/teichoic acid biosynthesis glycosyltransferase